jgi:hypothetical protein
MIAFLLTGCLFLAEPPPGADPSPECIDTGCAGGFTCDLFLDACATTCDGGLQPCQDDFTCDGGSCVEDCDVDDCDGFACDTDQNECFDSCDTNAECAAGFACCTTTKRDNGRCDDVGACF